jgi:hypothetical protein
MPARFPRLVPRALTTARLAGFAAPDRFVLTRVLFPAAAVLLAFAALRMTYPGSVEKDDADLILFNQMPAWGYSDMSPLYTWLATAAFRVLGVGVAALTAVRVAVLFLVCVLLYLNARLVCPDRRLAALATHSVLLIPALSWNSLTYLTHTNALIAACLGMLYTFLRLARDGRTRDHVFFGLTCGVGVLAKYNAAWFAAALILAGLTVAPVRRRLLDRRVALGVAAGGLLVLPHALWVLDNWRVLAYILAAKAIRVETVHLPYAVRALMGAREAAVLGLMIAGPVAAAVALFFRRAGRVGPNPDPDADTARRLVGRFLAAAGLVIVLQVVALGATRMHERWVIPFAAVLPLWLFARLDPAAVRPARARAFAALLVVFAAGYTVARTIQVASPAGCGAGWHPVKVSDDELARRIAAEAGARPTIVTPHRSTAGNLLLRLPAARVLCTDLLWLHPVPAGGGPVVLVWDAALGGQPPWLHFGPLAGLNGLRPLPAEAVQTVLVAPENPGAPLATVAYAVLSPVGP